MHWSRNNMTYNDVTVLFWCCGFRFPVIRLIWTAVTCLSWIWVWLFTSGTAKTATRTRGWRCVLAALWHWHVTLTYDTDIWHWHMTLTRDTVMWHWLVIWRYDTDIWHIHVILTCDISLWLIYYIWHLHVTLTCDSDMTLTCDIDLWYWYLTLTYDMRYSYKSEGLEKFLH